MSTMRASLGLLALVTLFPAQAAMPASGTLSPSTPTLSYKATYTQPNQSALLSVPATPATPAQGGLQCNSNFPCDDYALTVDLPANYSNTNPSDVITVSVQWSDPSGGAAIDYDLYVNDANGKEIAHSAGSTDPEAVTFAAGGGNRKITVRVVPANPAGTEFTTTIKLVTPAAPPGGTPATYSGSIPRYRVYMPPPQIAQSAGEPSVGYNVKTKRAMFIAGTETDRVTFAENFTPAMPASCDANWENVSSIYTKRVSQDPILFTDFTTGRTFVSQMKSVLVTFPAYAGLNSDFAYTDDDGANWSLGQVDPPEGGYDHQAVASGPYPAAFASLANDTLNKKAAVYYCSQAGVTAFCARSDNGGLAFGHGVPTWTTLDCGGLHGHPRVAPDGTVYLPNKSCNGKSAVAVSTDAGTTWTVRAAPNSTSGITDPQMAIAKDGTGYFCYSAGNGTMHVAVTKDRGVNWISDVEVSKDAGIRNAVFAQAIAGDADRAACAYIGSTTAGNSQAADYKGVWYPFISTTYDGGKTWVTVNVSPDDPVQREGGICNSGSGCTGNNRNLLDFNEISIDEKGRPVFGYADGCVGDCVIGPPNTFSAVGRIARQTGGKSLYAAFDADYPDVAKPAAACLAGERDAQASYLSWKVPDTGGQAISGYKVYRNTATGQGALVGSTTKPAFNDRSADPTVANYYYTVTALNAQGEGIVSNEVKLPLGKRSAVETTCAIPGITAVVDATGDAVDNQDANDIQFVGVSEPQALDGKIVFTLKVKSLSGTLLPNTTWAVRFGTATKPANGDEDYFVAMNNDAGQIGYYYGTTKLDTSVPVPGVPGTVPQSVRRFTSMGTLTAGAMASNYDPNGTITLVLDKTKIPGFSLGGSLTAVQAVTRTGAPLQGDNTYKAIIADATGANSYTLRTANFCLPNVAPTALLALSTGQGTAPLTVTLDGSGSTDTDSIDTVASYTFNFGDGSEEVTQASPKITHVYRDAGVFNPKLLVADSRGKPSGNVDQKIVSIDKAGTTPATPTPPTPPGVIPPQPGVVTGETGRFGGGALGLGLLLPLLLLRRRRR